MAALEMAQRHLYHRIFIPFSFSLRRLIYLLDMCTVVYPLRKTRTRDGGNEEDYDWTVYYFLRCTFFLPACATMDCICRHCPVTPYSLMTLLVHQLHLVRADHRL